METGINMRDERRKRIMERGSDRMALITGRIQSLPPSPRYNPSSPSSARAASSSTPHHRSLLSDPNLSSLDSPRYIPAAAEKTKDENDHGGKTLPDHKTTEEVTTKKPDHKTREEIKMPDHKTTEEIKNEEHHPEKASHNKKPELRKLSNINTTPEDKHPLPSAQQPSSIIVQKKTTETHREPGVKLEPIKSRLNSLCTSKELNTCIIASGDTRIFCSFVIAIMVVVSYVDYPLFGINLVRSQSAVASRPLYLLLLTDVTIVIGFLIYLKKHIRLEQAEEEEGSQAEEEVDNWEGALKVMERCLVVYQAIRGIFMDCSCYTVVVVCGLSLA